MSSISSGGGGSTLKSSVSRSTIKPITNPGYIRNTEIDSEVKVTKIVSSKAIARGAQGVPGVSEESSIFDAVAGETIQQYDPVYVENGLVYKAFANDTVHARDFAGLAINDGILGEAIQVICDGEIENLGWSWLPRSKVYLSETATLTQTPVPQINSNFHLVVGEPISATRMIVRISDPIVFDL